MERSPEQRAAARRGLLLIALAAVLWGTLGVGYKALYATDATDALSISFLRLAVAAPILLICARLMLGRPAWQLPPRQLGLALASGVPVMLSQVLFAAAVAVSEVTVVTLVTLCAAPVLVALASSLLWAERAGRRVLLALGAALSGTALLVAGQSGGLPAPGSLLGVLLALGAAASYALMTLLQRALVGRCHPLQLLALGLLAGLASLLPLGLRSGLVLTYSAEGWLLVLYLGLFPTVLSYLLFLFGMRHTTATVATIVNLLESVVAAALAWALLGERLSPLSALGALLLLGTLAVLYRE